MIKQSLLKMVTDVVNKYNKHFGSKVFVSHTDTEISICDSGTVTVAEVFSELCKEWNRYRMNAIGYVTRDGNILLQENNVWTLTFYFGSEMVRVPVDTKLHFSP
jgi:hypothetical protein